LNAFRREFVVSCGRAEFSGKIPALVRCWGDDPRFVFGIFLVKTKALATIAGVVVMVAQCNFSQATKTKTTSNERLSR
jgi:hypothetical protein